MFLSSKVIILVVISSIISNSIIIFQNRKYEEIYNFLSNESKINLNGIIISQKQEEKYYNKYKVQTIYNNKKMKIYITTDKKEILEYGDKIVFSGTYVKPEIQRNYKGFDYSQYLKQLKVYGTVKCERIEKINQKQANKMLQISNKISDRIIVNTKKILKKEDSSILLGLILGYKEDIDDEIQENFRNAGMTHILAVSGMHVTYVLLGINIILKNKIGKRNTNILSIFVLILYMFITNFSSSITRAGIMGIIMLFSKIIYRKNDIYTSISISLLLILIYNPFLIQNLGLQLSYGGVIGIIIFSKGVLHFLKNIKIKNKVYKYKIKPKIEKQLDKIKEIMAISISVQIFIIPIILYNSNTFNPYFLISNLVLSIFIGPIVILGFIFIIIVLINIQIAKIFSNIIQFAIQILIFISNIGKIPFSKIYIATPSIFSIISYYLTIAVIFYMYTIYTSKNPNKTQIRIKNLIALVKIKVRENNKKFKKIIVCIILTLLITIFIPKNLKIYFIDVGQGDSCMIVTPKNKTILIDGGGSVNSNFDVGEKTLIPYILDRGFTKIDIVIISHFDNDHYQGLIKIIEELKVKKIIVGKQFENSENYKEFVNLVKKKDIKVYVVEAGQRINIEKELYIDVLWPDSSNVITDNVLNNNSLVCTLVYKNFSCIFTGDIEEIAEKAILQKYKNNLNRLSATILKVAHHGSKTSSTKEFLKAVNPKIALIGVGENNTFGHPSNITLKSLEKMKCKIYRTDKNGEIILQINKKGKIWIDKMLN